MTRLALAEHVNYIVNLQNDKHSFEYYVSEHLRISGIYWAVAAMDVLGRKDEMDKDGIVEFVLSCQHENGGFGGNVDHDGHLLYTLSAVQLLCLFDCLDRIDKTKVVKFVKGLQNEDGSFSGDAWGEIDTRFSYCALSCLSLLGSLDQVNVPLAVEYIMRCRNFDGGYGNTPGAETHAGQVFTCVGALAVVGAVDRVDVDTLGWWLAERQLPCGGLNGRPEKLEDVCYSWWVISSLEILDRRHWIDSEALSGFILKCQDEENGGISDRPGDMVDVFHTFFGIAGLSLMGYPGLKRIDPVYALPVDTLKRMGLPSKYDE